jgi:VanZ family protein
MSADRFWQVTGWLLFVGVAVLTVSPSNLRPITGFGHQIEHLTAFAGLSLAFGMGYSNPKFLFFKLFALIFLLELLQVFVPGRHARLSDLFVNGVGMSIGLIAAAAINRVAGRR